MLFRSQAHALTLPRDSQLGQGVQGGVDLGADNGPGQFHQPAGKAACAGADFKHGILVAQIRGADHDVHQVEIDQEVLA